MRRIHLFPFFFLAMFCRPASAQAFLNFGQPLLEVSATEDARSRGISASVTGILHGGLAAYKLKKDPLQGPNTGLRLDLGLGMGDRCSPLEGLHISGGLSLVSDPSPMGVYRVNGLGGFANVDVTLGAHILVGVYGLMPLARGHDFGGIGLKVGVRLPPYR